MMSFRRLPIVLLALALPMASAQSGPWTDGEIIVRSWLPGTSTQAIYRIAPESGHGELLISGHYWLGWAGSLAFDTYRNGLLCSMSLPPDPYSVAKLWLVADDGSAAVIPGFTGVALRAVTPIGDGRVYYQRHQANPSNEVNYLDAANAVHTLMDATGAAPLSFNVEHMLYHAPTNSLLATTSGWWSVNDCAPNSCSFFRVPLSPDGSQVAGPIVCVPIATINQEIMSMDYLPGGNVILSLGNGTSSGVPELQSVDPVTLAVVPWANPGFALFGDINGGAWSPRAGGAVILDDINNLLRRYLAGESGGGTVIVADVPLGDGTTGYSPAETLIEIDTSGPGCLGTALPFGVGLGGLGNVVPTLAVAGCPDVGMSFTIAIDLVRGGASGVLAISPSPAAIPALGGTLYLFPITVLLPITVGGMPSQPGVGSVGLPILFTDPGIAGLTLYLQAGFLDADAAQGLSLTNALLLSIG